MAWRFKASKYKNAFPVAPKKEDLIQGLSLGSYRSHGNFIAASAAFMAFNWEVNGSNLGVLPLNTKGRQIKSNMPLIYAHSDFVTDFQFSPFDDGLLATASQDLTIKLWRIPETGLTSTGLNQPELVLPSQPRRVETVNFHPTADCILATTSFDSLVIWDLIQAKELYTFSDHEEEVQSVAWQWSGSLLATQSKDKMLRIFDPRTSGLVAECDSHQGIKDSKVVWINDSADRIFTTGFAADRLREITIRDMRNLKSPQKNLTLDMSAGILVPLYDPDTHMCFLAGKGDRNIQHIELSDKEPFIVEGLRYSGDQTKGACLVPKRAMNVMEAEVNRVLQLGDSSIVPINWKVPRKSYREYHSDIFPETYGLEPASGPENWWTGSNTSVTKMSLDPVKRPKENLTIFQGPLTERDPKRVSQNGQANAPAQNSQNGTATNGHPKPNPRPRCVVKANTASPPPASVNKPEVGRLQTGSANKPQIVPRVSSSSSFNTNNQNSFQKPATTNSDTTNQNNFVKPPEVKPKPQNSLKPEPEVKNSTNNGYNNNINQNNTKDCVDEGLAMLRRQPSIKDRKRMFEANIRKQEEQPKIQEKSEPPKVNVAKETTVPKQPLERQQSSSNIQKQSSIEKEISNNKTSSVLDNNIFRQNNKPKTEVSPSDDSHVLRSTSTASKRPESKRPVSKMFRVSKFKHLKGETVMKNSFNNLKNLSKNVPAESNFFKANPDRIVVPLAGPGGKLAIFETKKPGRIPDGVTPVLINGTTVLDFDFDPFDNSRIAASCDDGTIRIWIIPEEGLTRPVNEPHLTLSAHGNKVQLVKWHPLAQDILISMAFDQSVKIWNLNDPAQPQMELEGHTEQIFSVEWSSCGQYVATVCKDGKIRLYEPRKSSSPFLEGGEIVAKKGARIAWVLDEQYLIVTGFSKQSERQVMLYRVSDLELVQNTVLDVSPAILIPHYDHDSSTLFLTSKGENTVTTFEVATDSPYLFPLSPYRPSGLHQALAFLPKNILDTKNVEFARAYRLTNTTIEPLSFTVPRVNTAVFHDDIFPQTRVTWKPTLSAKDWFSGSKKQVQLVSLCPEGMPALSGSNNNGNCGKQSKQTEEDPKTEFKAGNIRGSGGVLPPTKEQTKEAETNIEQSVSGLVETSEKLEQDDMEGVDDNEWDNSED